MTDSKETMRFNEIISFKGRTLNAEKPIHVYRNLNRSGKVYSIRQQGVVVGHTTAICLRQCTFVVNGSGKDREDHVKVGYKPFNGIDKLRTFTTILDI